jgi:NAD(P)-dependent dehydrogenase (short-subunit alcohol dehydrogenase family)
MRLEGEVAVVLGSTRGIGRGIAIRLASEGAKVVVTGRTAADGQRVVDEIIEAGGTALFVLTDVGQEDQVRSAIDAAVDSFGSLTVLVNNAAALELTLGTGLSAGDNQVDLLENDVWEVMHRNSLMYVFWSCKYAIRHMRAAGYGSIINISSMAGVMGLATHAAYSAAKAGMNGLTRSVAAAYGQENIRCNSVVVGAVASSPEALQAMADPATGPLLLGCQMLPRPITVEEAAGLVAYLATREAYPITAASIHLDGGWHAKMNMGRLHDVAWRPDDVSETVTSG